MEYQRQSEDQLYGSGFDYMIHAQREYNEVGFHAPHGRPKKVVYESDQFESMHEGSNLDDWDDDSADPLDFQKYVRISYGSAMEDDSVHPFESNFNNMIDDLQTKVKELEALIQPLIQHGPQAEDVHELEQRRLKVELRVKKLRKQILLLITSHEEISTDLGLLMEFIRDLIAHERSGLTSLKDTMDMIQQVVVRLREIDPHVAQVQDNATQLTRVATVVDEMVQGIRYGGSVVEPNASVSDLFQGFVSIFRSKVSELEQFNTHVHFCVTYCYFCGPTLPFSAIGHSVLQEC